MRPRRAHHTSAGFTLMEVVLAVAIMSLLMVAMTQILTSARNTRDTIHNLQENQLAGPAILDMIERDLRAISIMNRAPSDLLRVRSRAIGNGDADSIDFVTNTNSLVVTHTPDRFVRADVNEVGYRLRTNTQDDDFLEIYRREGLGVDEEPFDGGYYSFLNERVKSLDILVYAADGPDEEPLEEWNTFDDEEVGLPARVEISLTLELAPRITGEALTIADVDEREVTYTRIFRFPEHLRRAIEVQPVVIIPQINAPSPEGGGAGGAGDALPGLGGGGASSHTAGGDGGGVNPTGILGAGGGGGATGAVDLGSVLGGG